LLTLASNSAAVAEINADKVTVSGTVPYYMTSLEIAGEAATVSTGHNIVGFSVNLINVGSAATVTSASAGCAAIIYSGRC